MTAQLTRQNAASSGNPANESGELDHSSVISSLQHSPVAIPLSKCIAAEAVGTALLLAAVVGRASWVNAWPMEISRLLYW
jgi:hypothetical protein